MIGVQALLQRFADALDLVGLGIEGMHLDDVAVGIEVELVAGQPVDILHPFQRQVAEHVVERPVFHHHDDDVLKSAQPLEVVWVHRRHVSLRQGRRCTPEPIPGQ